MGGEEETPAVQAVLAALDALYRNPDNKAKAEANAWLQTFQKTPEAWQTANTLLLSQSLPLEPRLFAAQTFRVKSTYDVEQIPRATLPSLRATLLTALHAYKQGPKVIQTQICLALAGIALQLRDGEDPEWGDDAVTKMIEGFGNDPNEAVTLLEFLTVLPEEITSNQRIPVDTEQYNIRSYTLLQRPALDVLRVLSMYIEAPGVTEQIQQAVFGCLGSWLKAGEISIQALMPTPLFSLSFDSLANEALFDVAVDVVCDIINETQEVEDNQEAVQVIVSRLLPLRAELQRAINDGDDDKVRGICRMFVQAGETYHRLMLQHREAFFPLVEAIFECARYTDLDIVQITFRFWYFLAIDIERSRQTANRELADAFSPVYQQLLEAIIRHLRFPSEIDSWNGQEKDDFKSFRHYMGDTLKDCCHVLGSQACLARSLSMIEEVLTKARSDSAVQWQDVEAPLFSMRAMGAEADPHDDDVLPRVMDVIPRLPNHPRLNYAALLVISRYTEWVNCHPERIPMVLSYISAGFNSNDSDVTAAAAQAMSYLGQDCDWHLVEFLPQLYDFYQTVVDRVEPEDGRSIAEAIGYVIARSTGTPFHPGPAMDSLAKFTQPLLQAVSAVANAPGQASKEELQKAADRMEQIERLVAIGGKDLNSRYMSDVCQTSCKEAFAVLDLLLSKYGAKYFIAERTCELLRRGIAFFDRVAEPVVPALLERLVSLFEQTGFASYVWIIGKSVSNYDILGGQTHELNDAYQMTFARVCQKVFNMLETSTPADIPDVMDDFTHTCTAIVRVRPDDLLTAPDPMLSSAVFRVAISVLRTMYQGPIVKAALDFVRTVVTFDVQSVVDSSMRLDCEATIERIILEQGGDLVQVLVTGMVTSFDPDTLSIVITINKELVNQVGFDVFESWVTAGLSALSDQVIGASEKQKFIESVQMALGTSSPETLQQAFQGLYKASRKSRERAHLDRQSAKALLEES